MTTPTRSRATRRRRRTRGPSVRRGGRTSTRKQPGPCSRGRPPSVTGTRAPRAVPADRRHRSGSPPARSASTFRSLGRGTRELKLEQPQRRDGFGLFCLAAAVVIAAAVWFSAGGPAGRAVSNLLRGAFGVGAAWLPPLLVVLAARFVRSGPDPESRGRLVVGWVALVGRRPRAGARLPRRPRPQRRRAGDAPGRGSRRASSPPPRWPAG